MIPKFHYQRKAASLRRDKATEGLAPYLPALVANLVPCASMHLHGTIAKLASERDDLGDDELRNTPGIAEWRVEDGDPMLCRISKIHLVGANAETADHDEVFGFFQNSSSELSLGTNANHMNVPCYIFQPTKALKTVTAYRIFSINCSSPREDLKNST